MAGGVGRVVLILTVLVAAAGCASTWEGLRRDSQALFGSSDESDVAEVQNLLNARGYAAGPVDGVLGPQTSRAIRAYQADHGLDVTGTIDSELVDHIEGSTPTRRARGPATVAEPEPEQDDWVDPY